jgi:hypothetical protein
MKVSELFENMEDINLNNKNIIGNLKKSQKDIGWSPITHRGNFSCRNNKLTSLEGMPENVIGIVDVENNRLTSLEGSPLSIAKSFICKDNIISSIDGAPKYVKEDFDISNNKLTNLKDIEKHISTIKGKLILSNNPIRANISGVLKIKELKGVTYNIGDQKTIEAFKILERHLLRNENLKCFGDLLSEELNLSAFEEELKKAGLEQFI